MDREFRSVGFWFNTHPLDAYRSRLERAGIRRKFRFLAYMQEKGMDTLSGRKLSGLVTDVMRFTSRRGLPYIKAVLAEKRDHIRSEEHTSELQSLMRNSYAVFCLKKKTTHTTYRRKQQSN